MLREKLRDEDIPHHTLLRQRIEQILEEHLVQLEHQMHVRTFYH